MANLCEPVVDSEVAAATTRPGGQILADALAIQGVDTVFGVPGESYLAVLDGLYRHRERIRFVVCRQEGGAAFMADAWAKLTGRPGVVMVTRGPGAANASVGVHAAFQDSVPMVVFVGQVGTDFLDREAFQEIDYRRMFGQMPSGRVTDRAEHPVRRARLPVATRAHGPGAGATDVLVQPVAVADAACHCRCASPGAAATRGDARATPLLMPGQGWTPQA